MPKYITEEYLDERFEAFGREVKASFDAVDERFIKVESRIDLLEATMNHRFETVEQKIADLAARMNAGFDTLDAFVNLYTRHEQEIAMNRFTIQRHDGRITALEQKP